MFIDNILAVLSLAFPDVCKIPTPVGPVPIPLLNLKLSSTRLPMVFNVLIGFGMTLNIFAMSTVSNGDEAGVAMGLVSNQIVGPGRPVLCSIKIFMGCAPVTRMCAVTMQNGMVPNAPGVTLSPGQVRAVAIV